MPTSRSLPCALAAVLLLAACGDTPAGPDPALDGAEADLAAAALDDLAAGVVDGLFAAPLFSTSAPAGGDVRAAVTLDESFTRTVGCPGGGSVTVQGRTIGTMDRATRTGARVTEATRVENACVVNVRNGATLTLSGAPSTAMRAEQSVTAGVPGPRTVTHRGAFTWTRSTGGSGGCAVDLVSVLNPETRTITVSGTFCGRSVNVTRTRG